MIDTRNTQGDTEVCDGPADDHRKPAGHGVPTHAPRRTIPGFPFSMEKKPNGDPTSLMLWGSEDGDRADVLR